MIRERVGIKLRTEVESCAFQSGLAEEAGKGWVAGWAEGEVVGEGLYEDWEEKLEEE